MVHKYPVRITNVAATYMHLVVGNISHVGFAMIHFTQNRAMLIFSTDTLLILFDAVIATEFRNLPKIESIVNICSETISVQYATYSITIHRSLYIIEINVDCVALVIPIILITEKNVICAIQRKAMDEKATYASKIWLYRLVHCDLSRILQDPMILNGYHVGTYCIDPARISFWRAEIIDALYVIN